MKETSENFTNVKTKKPKTKKGSSFYVALGVCLMAISVAIYSSYTSMKKFTIPEEDFKFSISKPSDILPKNQTILEKSDEFKDIKKYKDITKNSQVSSALNDETTNATLEPEIIPTEAGSVGTIVLPAGKKTGKKYSGENPVYSKTFNDWRIHNGIDFNLPKGDKVVALTDGTVKDIYSDPIYGTTMVIEHQGDFTAFYSGLGKTTMVNIGDKVENGTEIGSIGTLPGEALDGEHLHLSIKKGDTYIDPLEILGKIE